jgi:hypothetical protein
MELVVKSKVSFVAVQLVEIQAEKAEYVLLPLRIRGG